MFSFRIFPLLKLRIQYRGAVQPCMDYESHIWDGSTHTPLLEKVKSKALRTIKYSYFTNFLQTHYAVRLPSFSLYFSFNNGHCSSEISCTKLVSLMMVRNTRLSTRSHSFFNVYLSETLTQDLDTMFNLNCTLLVKSIAVFFLYFRQCLWFTGLLSNAGYWDMSWVFFYSAFSSSKLFEGLWSLPAR